MKSSKPSVATPGRKQYPWKNVQTWSKLYHKLQQQALHAGTDSLGSTSTNFERPPKDSSTSMVAGSGDPGETHLPIAGSSEQTLALMTVSASSLSDAGEDGPAIVDISKLTTVKVLDKRSGLSGVEYKCEFEPLWLTADLAERAQMGRIHIRSYENRLVQDRRLKTLRVRKQISRTSKLKL